MRFNHLECFFLIIKMQSREKHRTDGQDFLISFSTRLLLILRFRYSSVHWSVYPSFMRIENLLGSLLIVKSILCSQKVGVPKIDVKKVNSIK